MFKHDNAGICSSNSDGLLASIEIFYSEIKQKLNRKIQKKKRMNNFLTEKKQNWRKLIFMFQSRRNKNSWVRFWVYVVWFNQSSILAIYLWVKLLTTGRVSWRSSTWGLLRNTKPLRKKCLSVSYRRVVNHWERAYWQKQMDIDFWDCRVQLKLSHRVLSNSCVVMLENKLLIFHFINLCI